MQSNWVTVLITNYQNTSAMKSQATTGNVTTKRIFLSALHPNIVFRRNLQERFWHNAVLPLQLQKSGTVYRKISKTVVLWKLSDANLKLTCLTVHFLPRLVSPTPTNRLL